MQRNRRIPLGLGHPGRVFIVTALSILAVDQAAKAVVRATLSSGKSIVIIPDVFDLTYVRNVGAAFGMFPGQQPLFMLMSVVFLIAIGVYWYRARPSEWPIVVALALVASGAAGNLIDRAFIGQVTDFFYFKLIDFPVFNVADMALVVGVGLLMIWILFGPQPENADGGS
ncbi:MAG: signal peptidase II [Coriobacteriia bacterium]|nr:signal peptidase II [Coriobacteriia bacterium]